MGNVSVTRDSLQKIKASLKDFQTSVETSTSHMKSHAEDVVSSMRTSVKKQEAVVRTLKDKATQLTSSVEQCQMQIIDNNNRINTLRGQIENASSRMCNLENQIAKLRTQKQQLQSQSSSSDSSNDTSAQIQTIESQIQSCERQQHQLREQLTSLKNQESSLNTQNAKLRNDKARLDTALAKIKSDFAHAGEKCDQMKRAGVAAESCVARFLGVAQQYKQTVLTTGSTHTAGIEKCIAAIEEYERTNLTASNVTAGTAFSSYEQRLNRTPRDITRWESGVRGEGLCTTTNDEANAVLATYGLRGVVYQNAMPDFSPFAVYTVEIGNMQGGARARENINSELGGIVGNYSQADRALAAQLGVSIQEIRDFRTSHDPPLTWHERNDTYTMDLIPTIINRSFGHYGGTAEANAIREAAYNAEDLLDTIPDDDIDIPNAMDYSENQEAYEAGMEEIPSVSRGPVDLRF